MKTGFNNVFTWYKRATLQAIRCMFEENVGFRLRSNLNGYSIRHVIDTVQWTI